MGGHHDISKIMWNELVECSVDYVSRSYEILREIADQALKMDNIPEQEATEDLRAMRERVIQDHCAYVKSVWIRDKRLKIPGFFWTVPHESNGDARKVEIYRKVVVKYIVMLRRKMRICYKTPAQIKKEDDEAFKIHLDVSHLDTKGKFATTGMSSAVVRALQLPGNADLLCMVSRMDGAARRRLAVGSPQVVIF